MKDFLKNIKSSKHTYKIIAGIAVVGLTFGIIGMQNNSYAISVDGEVVGVVKTKEEAQAALENLVAYLKDQKGVDIAIKETVTVEHVNSRAKEIETQDILETSLKDTISYEIEAYEILVDDEVQAIVETQEIAERILSDIAKMHLPEGSGVQLDVQKIKEANEQVTQTEGQNAVEATQIQPATVEVTQEPKEAEVVEGETSPIEVLEVKEALKEPEVKSEVKVGSVDKEEVKEEPTEGQKIERELTEFDFNEKVVVRNTYVDEDQVLSEEEAKNILLGNTEEIVEYELKEGDNIWDIAIKHGTTMDHILEINPQIEDETRMQIGEVIKLEVPDPILSISTTEQATFKELIPAEIEYVEFSDLYKDETKVYQEGYDGVKEITVDVHKVNGKEVSRDLITEKVLKEPKTKVIAFGTKEKPKPTISEGNKKPSSSVSSSNSGMFMHPLNGAGTLTSNYGSRWGSFHRGLDIAAPAGTPIYAAASGTVTYSGYNQGGFGKLIIIDHNNGYQTYYAHCSSLYVQVGQKVSKGQNIAGVGSTGNSTGNHVHFELRSNGNPINPYDYVY